jgi:hypothetical protein
MPTTVLLRDVLASDLPIFFEQQLDQGSPRRFLSIDRHDKIIDLIDNQVNPSGRSTPPRFRHAYHPPA